MNTALVVITLVSVGTTAAVLLYAMRLLRDERERSEARVAALRDAIAAQEPAPVAYYPADPPAPLRPWPAARTHVLDARTKTADPAGDTHAVLSATESSTDDAEPMVHAPMLFGADAADHHADRRRTFALLAGVLVVLAVAGIGYLATSRTDTPAAGTRTAAPAPAPLELLALRHARRGGDLTISGLVRNPPSGAPQAHVSAVVFLFGRDGTFLASGRAPLDYQQLAAGDESPFVVTVPKAGAVARYRVSFRTDRDVVPHVDRRTADAARAASASARTP